MNKKRLEELAKIIEKQPHTSRYDKSGFNIKWFYHECGTPACIGGFTRMMMHQLQPEDNVYKRACQQSFKGYPHEWLDITEKQYSALFAPEDLHWPDITPQWAAACIRNLIETDEVDWKGTRPETV